LSILLSFASEPRYVGFLNAAPRCPAKIIAD
jgi:hypothetical protein